MKYEALKIFSDDLAKELKAKLQGQETAEFVSTVKASGDDRTFEVVMSTADEDRQGDELDQSKWDLKYFDMNPVVLWAHNYGGFPIGIVTDIEIQGDKAIATGKFAPAGVNPEADMACALYQQKILRAVSPGYIQNDDGTRELLEMSFCPVPAGKFALSLRQVRALGVSTSELVTKGFFFDEKAVIKEEDAPPEKKAEEIGDQCEGDDGGLGVLADDPKNPGHLICVPNEEGKAQKKPTTTMKEELTKKLKAESTRHGEAVAKSIADYSDDKDKSIDEFEKAIDDEHDEHLDKCMKAIDDSYELDEQKKSIDDFKTAMQGEHVEHVKCMDKAIDEFKSALADGTTAEDRTKAIDDFSTKSAAELGRHEDAQRDLVKAEMGEGETDEEKALKNKGQVADELAEDEVLKAKYAKLNEVYDIFYAFTSAFMDDRVAIGEFEKLLDEAVALMKGGKEKSFVSAFIGKSTTVLPAAVKEKLTAVIKTLEAQTEREKSTNDVIASLKELTGSPQEDEGEEQKPDDQSGAAPEQRPSPPVATESKSDDTPTEFETYLRTRKLLKAVYQASGDGLAEIKKALREKYPDRR